MQVARCICAQKDKEERMPAISGSFSGKANWQTVGTLKDVPDHDVSLAEISGPQQSSDPEWNGSRVTYWGIADLMAGNGTQRGYFINEHPDGDSDRGTFEGTVTAAVNQVNLSGNWTFTGGTGKLNGITGSGTYRGRMTSATQVEMEWEGTYELAETKASAG
jgi:hypothetical protein